LHHITEASGLCKNRDIVTGAKSEGFADFKPAIRGKVVQKAGRDSL
jgi:hypothetical protein